MKFVYILSTFMLLLLKVFLNLFLRGEEYAEHIKCMTEEQRYGAKNAVTNVVKKGEIKQEEWTKFVKSLLSKPNISPSIKQFLQKLADRNNIPRKRTKFIVT